MSSSPAAFDTYFRHLGYDGPYDASLQTLRRLHLLHAQAIPFENLTPFLGQEVRLDVPSLIDKFVNQGRGGYCFEHNLLFHAVLDELGFRPRALAARVRWNLPPERITPRSHMLLMVEIEGERFIADVGFGGLTLTAPLRLEPGLEQETPHGPFRLLLDEGTYTMEARMQEEWRPLYRFDLTPQFPVDYEVSSWYLSHHPQSPFVAGLICARPTPQGRHALAGSRYTFYRPDGERESAMLDSAEAIMDVLRGAFGIRLPESALLRTRLDELVQAQR